MSYFPKAMTPTGLVKIVRRAKRDLAGVEFDAIAVTGVSGTVVAGLLAAVLKKRVVVVRKERSHDYHKVVTPQGKRVRRYIVVDDFVETGSTVKRIVDAVREATDATCVGLWTYQNADRNNRIPLRSLNAKS